jgi:transcriptional regulator with XRE-family HTH domain
MVTSAQLRAARALLNWTVRDLAEKAGVHRNTVTRAETDSTAPGHAVAQIIRTFEAAGVEFTNGGEPGAKLVLQIQELKPSEADYRFECACRGQRFRTEVTKRLLDTFESGMGHKVGAWGPIGPIIHITLGRRSPENGALRLLEADFEAAEQWKRQREAPVAIPVDKRNANNDE